MTKLTDEQVGRWRVVLESQTGINLTQHEHILRKGLVPWLEKLSEADAEPHLQRLERKPHSGVGPSLVDFLAVKETRFFRSPAAFRYLRTYLEERLRSPEQHPLRINMWSAGCSTGEEAYSMAFVAMDVFAANEVPAYVAVTGTDISQAALRFAREGRYGARSAALLPTDLQEKYLQPVADRQWQVSDSLRNRVCFLQANLLQAKDLPVTPMDVIFCHNVLVYFRYWRQKQTLDQLMTRLKPGGILVIGPGEAAGWQHPQLERITGGEVQVFRRRPANSQHS